MIVKVIFIYVEKVIEVTSCQDNRSDIWLFILRKYATSVYLFAHVRI